MNIDDWQKLPTTVREILEKYRIISEQERTKGGQTIKSKGYTTANLRSARDAEGRVLGDGYLLDLAVVKRLIEADTSEGYEWLDWMLFHCGGGTEGQRRAAQSLEQTMDRFIDERVRGYRDGSGKYHPAVSKQEAEAKWAAARNKFRDVLMVGDQDIVERLHVFGFHRNWPGPNKIYETACTTVKDFLALMPKTKEMNTFMSRQGSKDKIIRLKPKDYATVESLQQANAKVERFFASKAAREDIQVEKIYSDDYLDVICPLTYAAAVRYGWDAWQFANREHFESNLEGSSNGWADHWRNTIGKENNVVVYMQFHVPVPSWVSYVGSKFVRFTMQNLALVIKQKQLKGVNLLDVPVLDEEARANMTLGSYLRLVEDEPKRVYDPTLEEYPVHVGPPVYASEDEAAVVLDHTRKALDRVEAWAAKFDYKRVIANYMPQAR
jgi:hypothetical protein